jgi:hypothetical protein
MVSDNARRGGLIPMQSATTVVVRTSGQPKGLIGDQISKMRMWLDNRGIFLAGFVPVPLGDDEVAIDAFSLDPEQADLFRAVFG